MTSTSVAYAAVTERIITLLEHGSVPWRKPWGLRGNQKPQNAFSHKPYRGVNAFITGLSGFTDPRWATFNQIRANGGHVNAGAKGTPVVFWKQLEVEDQDEPDGKKTIPMLRLYHVFNVEQTTGLKLKRITLGDVVDKIEAAEKIVAAMPMLPSVANDGGDQAYYRPASDSIHMPVMASFNKADDYYSVLFHELTHSTGHASRLDRGLSTNLAPFGSADYSKEELVAELGSAFISNEAGIQNDLPNSAAYIASWMRALRDDKTLVVHAASRAQKAADYILGRKEVA